LLILDRLAHPFVSDLIGNTYRVPKAANLCFSARRPILTVVDGDKPDLDSIVNRATKRRLSKEKGKKIIVSGGVLKSQGFSYRNW
jgi:hypothetical protein